MVRHFGVFDFKPGVDHEQIEECFRKMKGMVGVIGGLMNMEFGPYNSDEGLNDNFSHGFIMTFDSVKSRDEYLPHPIHEKVKDYVVPRLARVVVFDFVVDD
jgi:hypothetical protein